MHISKHLLTIATAAFLGTALTVPAYAETISGRLESADSDSIDGWAWDSEDFNHIVNVELQITPEGASEAVKTLTTKADNYREDLHVSIKDGWHGFSCAVDWDTIEGDSFSITAYVVTEESRTKLEETITYKKIQLVEPISNGDAATVEAAAPVTAAETSTGSAPAEPGTTSEPGTASVTEADGPGAASAAKPEEASDKTAANAKTASSNKKTEYGPGMIGPGQSSGKKGASLGIFKTTGYCNCRSCSGGHNLTYSGTVPKANHTISADISKFPIGTRLMIGDIIYTVEDIGSSIYGNKIDIFYASHQEAWNHGTQEAEVFLVE